MTPEEKSLLERTYKMVEDNNAILQSIRRTNRFSIIMRVFYWVLVLAIGFGAYYFIQPYVDSMLGIVGQAQQVVGATGNTIDKAQGRLDSITDLLR
jgi:lipoprotein signal peptidase